MSLCQSQTVRIQRHQERFAPAMRPITPDVLMRSPACMFSVAMIHLFRLPPATSAMSADLVRQLRWLIVRSSPTFLTEVQCGESWAHLHGSYRTSTTFSSKGLASLPGSKDSRWKSIIRYLCLWPPPMPCVRILPVWQTERWAGRFTGLFKSEYWTQFLVEEKQPTWN